MADIIELEIVAKATGLKPMVSTVERLERQLIRATKALDQNKISQDRYNKIILSTKQQYVGLGNSLQKANSEVNKFTSATSASLVVQNKELQLSNQIAVARRQATAENARHTAEKKQAKVVADQAIATEERLKNKFIQGYAAMDIYTKELRDLSMARSAGIISTEEQSAATQRLNMQMSKGTGAFSSYGSGVAGATQKQSKLGVVAQQSGYQVGDFLVQIQSGANPMMAFGQQATQLVGVMSLFGGKMLFAGAALGIIIPLVTAIAGSMLRSSGAVKDFSEAMDDATSALDEYISLAGAVDDTISESFDLATESIQATSEAYQDLIMLAKLDAFDRVNDLNDSLINSARSSRMMKNELEEVMLLLSATPEEGSSAFFANANAEASGFNDLLDDLKDAEGLRAQYQAAVALRDSFRELTSDQDKLTDGQRDFLSNLSESIVNLELMGAATGEETEAQKALREAEDERVRGLDFMNNLKEIGLGLTYDQYEADRKAADEYEQQVANIRNLMGEVNSEANTLTQSTIDMAKELGFSYEETVKFQEELEKAEDYALGITDADMASGIMDAAAQAAVLATNMGISLGLALKLQDIAGKSREENLFDAQVTAGIIPPWASYESNTSGETPLALQSYMDAVDNRVDARKDTGPSGGGSQASDQPDFVEALRAEMVVREQLVKLYGDEYELQSEIARIVKGLGEDSSAYNAQDIAALAQQNILLKEQEVLRDEAAAQMESVYKMLGDEMGTAFTSMIDGTESVKDAFKSMAKSIIDQLIQIYIVDQMVGAILGGFGGGVSTNVVSGPMTSSIRPQMRAGGGPVTEGMPYIVGENEPELFVPKSSGNIYNQKQMANMGKGSGGDNVVIHQNFNFQANGDDSVKKIIQQAAPQIAQMTKSSMLNDRRRGGQTKAVFG
jgi:hypothetical protein